MGWGLHGLNLLMAPKEGVPEFFYWLAQMEGKKGKRRTGALQLPVVKHQKWSQTLLQFTSNV